MPNANIDYVTSHQRQAHITTQNVIDLLAGLSGDVSGIKKFPQLYNGLSHEITDALTIQVKTGAALAGGSFFILGEAFDWMLDPGAVGYSRIDVLYVVMSEDPDTAVQSCDFVYEVGNLYPNGTTGTVPSAPTGTNITATYPFLRMDMTDGSIVSVTDYSTPYLSNSSLVTTVNDLVEQLEESVGGTVEQVQTNTNEIAQMKVTFQDGVDTIYNGLTTRGMSPTASTPEALSDAVGEGLGNLYDYAWANGHDSGVGHDDATIDEVKSAIDAITEMTWTERVMVVYTQNWAGWFWIPLASVVSIRFDGFNITPTQSQYLSLILSTYSTLDMDANSIRNTGEIVNSIGTVITNFTSNEKYLRIYVRGEQRPMFTITRQAKVLR
jgi:hypothetical protein